MTPEPDAESWIERASRGDEGAIERLLLLYLPSLQAFLRLKAGALLRDKESCTDLAQSVCRDILENAERFQFDGELGFRKWLFKTALRKLADRYEYYLAAKRDAGREQAGTGDRSSLERDLLARYGTFATPSRQAAAREELERVERAFHRLPADQQEVILLARVMGLPRAEVAVEMGRSEPAVRTLLSRALAALAEIARIDRE